MIGPNAVLKEKNTHLISPESQDRVDPTLQFSVSIQLVSWEMHETVQIPIQYKASDWSDHLREGRLLDFFSALHLAHVANQFPMYCCQSSVYNSDVIAV